MLNRQLCLGLCWPLFNTSWRKAVLGLFYSACANSHSDCKTTGWMVQGSKEREGANLSDDLALQLHLQLGIVTAGVGEIPSGRMSCKWSNRRYIGLSWPGWWTRGETNLGLA